jgi:CelD/BcsL family acetyltransferase involved in cellulose biosynthesis
MHIVHIDNLQDLRNYTDRWSALLEHASESSAPFLSPAWALNWWDHFGSGKTLSFLALFDKDRMVGIGPLAISKNRSLGFPIKTIGFVGAGLADHLDFYVVPELRDDGLPMIFDYIVNRLEWDMMDLRDVPADSENVKIIKELAEQHKLSGSFMQSIPCPYLSIDGKDWESFYSEKRSKSTRQDLQRRFRRLSEVGRAEFRTYNESEDVPDIFPQLFSVYTKRWDKKNISLAFSGEPERRFYVQMAVDFARSGKLDVLTLEVNGDVIAFTLSVTHGTQFTWLITAHDPDFEKYYPGELVLVRLLENTFRQGKFHEFDFTRGDEPYKYKWTDQSRPNLRILMSNGKIPGRMLHAATLLYLDMRKRAKRSKLMREIKLNLLGKIKASFKRG